MQKRYLVEVSAKFDEWGDFKTLVNPVLVDEMGLLELFEQYGLDAKRQPLEQGMDTFYSPERQYPFNRLLIMNNNANFDLKSSIDKLMVNLCSFVRPAPQPGPAHDQSVK